MALNQTEVASIKDGMETAFAALDESAFMRQQMVMALSAQILGGIHAQIGFVDPDAEDSTCQYAVRMANKLLDTIK